MSEPHDHGSPAGAGMLERAGEIFLSVRELGLPARDEAIDRLCAGTVELKDLVMLLVRGDQAPLPVEGLADDIRAAHDGDATIESRAAADAHDRIGAYRVLERLGEGGFGVVYMAEQERPVRRRVALKIIKLGMDTRQVVARFEAERQALALMDHPNIAKVFDAGATETGRPYFVMELVRGAPITEFCDRTSLSIRDRLELIAQVCDALHHAHQKGVIHRDIKPTNVLVEESDAAPHNGTAGRYRVRIIDFGIAKATRARLTEKTVFTEFRQMIGTPEYMSPEQAGESAEDVDTRTDVYSTGVLLYELLTGATPFDSERLRSAAYAELQRIIREEEPPRPSNRLTTCPETLQAVAGARSTHPVRLARAVRGELDWIVMKALEKDRSRRYDSAGAMALDIRRYLSGGAVHAAPPSRLYRARTLVRRHRGSAIAVIAVAGAVLAGLVGTGIGLVKANRRANELGKVAAFQARMLARLDAAQTGKLLSAEAAAHFERSLGREGASDEARAAQIRSFADHWKKVNPTDLARSMIDHVILRPSIAALDAEFADEPFLDARLRDELAHRYRALGMYDDALQLQRRVAESRAQVLGHEHRDTVAAIVNMAGLLHLLGRLDEAETHARDATDKMRRIRGPEHRDTLLALHALGIILRDRGKMTEAEACLRESMERMRGSLGDESPDTLNAMMNLAGVVYAQGRLDEAEAHLTEATERMRRALGAEHRATLNAVHNLGALLQERGDSHRAEAHFREALEKKARVLGEAHPETLFSACCLGSLLTAQGRCADAVALLAPLERVARQSGTAPRSFAPLLLNLGRARAACAAKSDDFTAAETNLLEAETLARDASKREHAQALADLYTAWHNADSSLGHDGRAAEWRERAGAESR